MGWASSLIDVYPSTEGAISRELRNAIRGDILSLNIGFMCIAAYAYFMLSRCRAPVQSRAMLCSAGLVSCGISIAIAFSMGACFRDLNQVPRAVSRGVTWCCVW